MMNCFFLCGLLQNKNVLADVLKMACRILLPGNQADTILGSFADRMRPIPHKSTLSRLALRVDVAYLLYTRRRLQESLDDGGLVVYPMVDASPQACPIVLYCIVLYGMVWYVLYFIVLYCIQVLYCIVLYCIVL